MSSTPPLTVTAMNLIKRENHTTAYMDITLEKIVTPDNSPALNAPKVPLVRKEEAPKSASKVSPKTFKLDERPPTPEEVGENLSSEKNHKPSKADDFPNEDFEEKGVRGVPAACLFVASLASNRSDSQLQKAVAEHFAKWGKVINVKVLKDPQQRPYAFVQYEAIEDAKRALLQAPNTLVEGRPIRVEQARVNRTLFLGRLNRNFQEEDVKRLVLPYGDTEDIHLLRNNYTGRSKCCAFVKFGFRDDAIRAYMGLKQNLAYITEWATNIERAIPRADDIDNLSIFVGLLNESAITKELLQQRFEQYGKIVELHLIKRPSRGQIPRPAFAFIKYENEDSTQKALNNENHSLFLGRTIRVEPKQSPEFRQLQSELIRQQQLLRTRATQWSPNFSVAPNPIPLPRQPTFTSIPPFATKSSNGSRPFNISLKEPKANPQRLKGKGADLRAINEKISSNFHKEQRTEQPKEQIETSEYIEKTETTPIQDLNSHPLQDIKQSAAVQGANNSVPPGSNYLNYQPPMAIPISFGPDPLQMTSYGINEGFPIPHELLYYAAPYIQTPEGPIFPYAPPISFMGAPGITAPSVYPGTNLSYCNDIFHENPASLPPPSFPIPLLHEHVPPVIPGQRDAQRYTSLNNCQTSNQFSNAYIPSSNYHMPLGVFNSPNGDPFLPEGHITSQRTQDISRFAGDHIGVDAITRSVVKDPGKAAEITSALGEKPHETKERAVPGSPAQNHSLLAQQ
ncbi:hypothetical protein G9A89_023654 [Geosiphon pyriformis]|nr:hypothetical protein G9A89_023654 [Geosiphon pyriformis]